MKKLLLPGLILLAASAPLGAQGAEPEADPRDRIVPEGVAPPAIDYIGEPWWMPLGECVAAFRQAQDNGKAQLFARLAMTRIIEDRAVKATDAAAVVAAWARTRGGERAGMMIGIYSLDAMLERCDELQLQYEAG